MQKETHYPPSMNDGKHIFVFGSNLNGWHGAGAALDAANYWGAVYAQGTGRQGMSYAIPTKDMKMRSMPLMEIELYVGPFFRYATYKSQLTFLVTRIGCGLAGYKDSQIAPMFKDAPSNCILPAEWKDYVTTPPPS